MKRVFSVLALLFPFLVYCQTKTTGGKVTNEENEPLSGATITLKGTERRVVTDHRGAFSFPQASERDTLVVSSVGYQTMEVPVRGREQLTITLTRKVGVLDEAVVIAYGTTTRRLATGSVARVGSEVLQTQPVGNVLAALGGRVPGLVVSQTSGVPGAAFKVEIRGRTALDPALSRNDPLFIIDGVPFAPGNEPVNRLSSAANDPRSISQGGLSPLHTLNPADIESVEVLRDADATAIYGARGANGVVLITTRKGKPGKTSVQASLYVGRSRVGRTVDFLTTPQYLGMRREAFQNEGLVPTAATAPDLLLWDTTRYTDFKKLLIGGTAQTLDGQVSLAGGGAATRFLIGSGYHRETTVFPGKEASERGSVHVKLDHEPSDRKAGAHLSVLYSTARNRLPKQDLTTFLNLPPHFPDFYTPEGKLKWEEGGVSFSSLGFTNPMADGLVDYQSQSDQLSGNLSLHYRPLKGLVLKAGLGYNQLSMDEGDRWPAEALDPQFNLSGSAKFAYSFSKSWIAEPLAEYSGKVGGGTLSVVAGGSLQAVEHKGLTVNASGYTSDLLLSSVGSAGSLTASNTFRDYRYSGLFGRMGYNYAGKYLLNLSGRRDGSSRFGPGRRFALFGAAGAGWIFSSEPWVRRHLPLLSHGKLRGSYGTTGNDQIGDYGYLDSWTPTAQPYGGMVGLRPARLFNEEYSWETTRKLEAALELGVWEDRLLVTGAWYRNRSSNGLVSYGLPVQTGFTSLSPRNLPALVENSGWELTAEARPFKGQRFSWTTSVNLSRPKNKLVSFPGLATSSYASRYVEGASLNLIRGYRYTGVDPSTGLYRFEDVDKDGRLSYPNDFQVLGSRDPALYGGWQNSWQYRGWQLDVFWEGRKGKGANFLAAQSTAIPGFYYNQPVYVLERWQGPGSDARQQRFTPVAVTDAYKAAMSLMSSDALYSDVSYLRLKNASLAFRLPAPWLRPLRAEAGSLFVQGQNLLTLTTYEGADPETQNLYTLPPLRTLAAGMRLTF